MTSSTFYREEIENKLLLTLNMPNEKLHSTILRIESERAPIKTRYLNPFWKIDVIDPFVVQLILVCSYFSHFLAYIPLSKLNAQPKRVF